MNYSKSPMFRQRCKPLLAENIVKTAPLTYTRHMEKLRRILRKATRELFLFPTHLYRVVISPWLPPSCIYTPSCSAYMVESVRRHGILKGTALGLARIGRCHHTFFYGGPDPVPEEFSRKAVKTPYTIFRRHRHKNHDEGNAEQPSEETDRKSEHLNG